jgi:WD40 repeat protein
VALSGDGKCAVSGSCDHTVRVWDLESNQPPRLLEGHTNVVNAVALSGNGQRAISGSWDHTLRVWDLETGRCLAVFICDASVYSCAWARERARIVAGDGLGNVHLFAWEE